MLNDGMMASALKLVSSLPYFKKNLESLSNCKEECIYPYVCKFLDGDSDNVDFMKHLSSINFSSLVENLIKHLEVHLKDHINKKNLVLNTLCIESICENSHKVTEDQEFMLSYTLNPMFMLNPLAQLEDIRGKLFDYISQGTCNECNTKTTITRTLGADSPISVFITLKSGHKISNLESLYRLSSCPLSIKNLFTSPETDYKLAGLIFFNDFKYAAAILEEEEEKRLWTLITNHQPLRLSLFDLLITKLPEGFIPYMALYTQQTTQSYPFSLNAWKIIETKMIKTKKDNVVWKCECGLIIDTDQCACRNPRNFNPGWICTCLRKNTSDRCRCGTVLDKCFNCQIYWINSSVCKKCSKSYQCSACGQEYDYDFKICAFCMNPNEDIFLNTKFLSEPKYY
jgi:ribosomal protein S15P/S13E